MARLDDKLAAITGGSYGLRDFIIADAKDGDMGFGAVCPGPSGTGRYRSLDYYLDQMEAIVEQDAVDVMLSSVGSFERLKARGVFENSDVTPAVRLNDTTDIWSNRHSHYKAAPSVPFRTARLDEVRRLGLTLGLYSMTFCDDIEADVRTLEAFRTFRDDIASQDLRWFLEVFNPNVDLGLTPEQTGYFVNDWIVRALAGLSDAERPTFLKIVFNGAGPLEELASYDSQLVVGVLGGSAGTTHDTFQLLRQASQSGAKVALFGHKINLAESPLDIIALMRPVVEGDLMPADAVRAYHGALQAKDLAPARSLDDDLQVTDEVLKPGAA